MDKLSTINTTLFPVLYAGSISYYAWYISKKSQLDIFEPFVKQTLKNRARIYGANGVISLSIPVQKNSQKLPLNQVQISNIDAWQRTHWRSIESSYKSSPFFEYYAYLWEPLFVQKFESLLKFNLAVHQVVLHCLQLPVDLLLSSQSSPFMATDLRATFNIKGAHTQAHKFDPYQQVFSYQNSFEPDLSILDAIFNLGPETEDYLHSIFKNHLQ